MFEIKEVPELEAIFPGAVKHLMPRWEEIPAEFKEYRGTKWNGVFNDWFYHGAKNVKYKPKPGVDTAKAMRHVRAVMGSFEPKHEHKEAAVAYLLSQWFEDISYEKGGEPVYR